MGLVNFNLGDIGNLLTSAREAITGKKIIDPEEIAKLDAQLQQLDNRIQLGQLEVNKAEAQSKSLFVAGARPFIIWIGGLSLAWTGLAHPLLMWVWAFAHIQGTPPPVIDSGALTTILGALLGVAGMRSFDKTKGTQTDRI